MTKWTLALWVCLTIMAAASASAASLTISWTAPGDDGNNGTAAAYDLRCAPTPINGLNWGSAVSIPNLPAPKLAGTVQSITIDNLDSTKVYYFAMRAVDDNGNWSGVSDNAAWTFCECEGIPGNVSGDPYEEVNVSDLNTLIMYLFKGLVSVPCIAEANVDQDINGDINIADMQRLVAYLFQGDADGLAPCR